MELKVLLWVNWFGNFNERYVFRAPFYLQTKAEAMASAFVMAVQFGR
jgi:hypothetical protein